jgi:enoyl-CoA hydratase/long-chain 3-hydroxyacyl-CoA dehydrogenase
MDKAFEYEYVSNMVFNKARAQVMGQTKGLYPAPLKIIDVIKVGLQQGPMKGYEAEAKGFSELGVTSESKALIHLFQGHTQCKKNRFGAPKHATKTIGVLGAGLMGAGIAQVSIDKGYKVILKDMSDAGLARGYNQIAKGLSDGVRKKKMTK